LNPDPKFVLRDRGDGRRAGDGQLLMLQHRVPRRHAMVERTSRNRTEDRRLVLPRRIAEGRTVELREPPQIVSGRTEYAVQRGSAVPSSH
jgi:hypothetical protein